MAVHHGGKVGVAAKKLASSRTQARARNLLRPRRLLDIRLRNIAKERCPIMLRGGDCVRAGSARLGVPRSRFCRSEAVRKTRLAIRTVEIKTRWALGATKAHQDVDQLCQR